MPVCITVTATVGFGRVAVVRVGGSAAYAVNTSRDALVRAQRERGQHNASPVREVRQSAGGSGSKPEKTNRNVSGNASGMTWDDAVDLLLHASRDEVFAIDAPSGGGGGGGGGACPAAARAAAGGRPEGRTVSAVRHHVAAQHLGRRDDVAGGVEDRPRSRRGGRAPEAARRGPAEQAARARGGAPADGSRAGADEHLLHHPARPGSGPRADRPRGFAPQAAASRHPGGGARHCAGAGATGEYHRRARKSRIGRRAIGKRSTHRRSRIHHEPIRGQRARRPARRGDAQAQGADIRRRRGGDVRPRAVVRGQGALRVRRHHGG